MTNSIASTRDRLLEVGGKLFADKGFSDTTVAEICRSAEANIAAVNYHFGSKEKLYGEAWRHAHAKGLAAFPPNGGVPADAPAAERLRGRIRGLLQRALADEGVEFRIMGHEMAKPTGLLHQIAQETIRPMRQATEKILLELLGGQADPQVLRLCDISIMGPCMMIVRRQHLRPRDQREGIGPEFTPGMLEEMVEHFATFALAGVAAIRTRGAGSKTKTEQAGEL